MQYCKTDAGFALLPKQNVDYGGGLERIAAASIDSPDVYRISLLWPIVQKIEELSGVGYDDNTVAMRVIADHIRGAVFLAVDGVVPSNKEQGYVMRRLVRRAIRFAHQLGVQQNLLTELVPVVAGLYADAYPEVADRRDVVIAVLEKEERAFRRTLGKGLRELKRLGKTGETVNGDDLFKLYDTFGFPVELSTEEALNRELPLSENWREEFDAAIEVQRTRSQASTKLGAGTA
jgi:alanyl-tRNA synthetase